jgi:hypothetical protein
LYRGLLFSVMWLELCNFFFFLAGGEENPWKQPRYPLCRAY